jgi:hypothetical protein
MTIPRYSALSSGNGGMGLEAIWKYNIKRKSMFGLKISGHEKKGSDEADPFIFVNMIRRISG